MSNLHPTFRPHLLNEKGAAISQQIRERFSDLAFWIEKTLPDGRERAMVLTELERASYSANRANAKENGTPAPE